MTQPRLCGCCGAPVGTDGRYEREPRDTIVTPDRDANLHLIGQAERYEGSQLATNVTLTAELGALRNAYPHGCPGSLYWWRHRMGHATGCVICGGELPANAGRHYKRVASHRMYCSNACRQRAHRIMKSAQRIEVPHDSRAITDPSDSEGGS
jgi:hypothetical protein